MIYRARGINIKASERLSVGALGVKVGARPNLLDGARCVGAGSANKLAPEAEAPQNLGGELAASQHSSASCGGLVLKLEARLILASWPPISSARSATIGSLLQGASGARWQAREALAGS